MDIEKILNTGQSVLLVRYSSRIIDNPVERHKEVVDKNGHCWYGIIGSTPSDKIINQVLSEKIPAVVMLGYNKAHLCRLAAVERKKPEGHFPEYYEEVIFNRNQMPGCYLKFESIDEVDISILYKLFVISSGRTVYDVTHNHCLSPFLLVSFGSFDESKLKKIPKKNEKELPANECLYRTESGKCGKKSCVNYSYECEKPELCSKQKR